MGRPKKNVEGYDVGLEGRVPGMEGSEDYSSIPVPVEVSVSPKMPESIVPDEVICPAPARRQSTYAADALIPCRSLVAGYLNMRGGKTGNTYSWPDMGYVEYIEYQDLQFALLGRSSHLQEPLIIIEDEELLKERQWEKVGKIYENIYSSKNLSEVLNLPVGQMIEVIKKLPIGAKNSIVSLARTKMEDGSFDSIQKVKRIDELLGTDLKLFLVDG